MSKTRKNQPNVCSQHVVNLYFTGISMNNLGSDCGLVDAKIRASDKNLPLQMNKEIFFANFVTKKLSITN